MGDEESVHSIVIARSAAQLSIQCPQMFRSDQHDKYLIIPYMNKKETSAEVSFFWLSYQDSNLE